MSKPNWPLLWAALIFVVAAALFFSIGLMAFAEWQYTKSIASILIAMVAYGLYREVRGGIIR